MYVLCFILAHIAFFLCLRQRHFEETLTALLLFAVLAFKIIRRKEEFQPCLEYSLGSIAAPFVVCFIGMAPKYIFWISFDNPSFDVW